MSSTTPAERHSPNLPPLAYRKDIRLNTTQLEGKPRDPYDAPVRLLTKRLIVTYKRINTVRAAAAAVGPQIRQPTLCGFPFCLPAPPRGRRRRPPPRALQVYYRKKNATKIAEADGVFNDGYDDTNYDYTIELGQCIGDSRYEVVKKLGKVRTCCPPTSAPRTERGARCPPPRRRPWKGRPATHHAHHSRPRARSPPRRALSAKLYAAGTRRRGSWSPLRSSRVAAPSSAKPKPKSGYCSTSTASTFATSGTSVRSARPASAPHPCACGSGEDCAGLTRLPSPSARSTHLRAQEPPVHRL